MLAFGISFGSPINLAVAAAAALLIVGTAAFRRIRAPWMVRSLLLLGLVVLVVAAGGPAWHRPDPRQVLVMVDLSASTRDARYRDPAWLKQRISQLLAGTAHQVIYFASENRATAPQGEKLPDLPAERTIFQPPPAAAVLLFSDVQFELPAAAPPTYVVRDPLLEEPSDASVERLEVRDQNVAAAVNNRTGEPRNLELSLPEVRTRRIDRGSFVVAQPISQGATIIGATMAGDDSWPENDRLTIRVAPPALSQRWWVGAGAPPGWRSFGAATLPFDSAEYLAPSIIVLNNVSASDLAEDQHKRLYQYVRDLGGALMILGGDHAFAAGAYTGTRLEALSPLASAPPKPALHWIVLADSSGSMAEGESGATRWDLARQAILRILPHLPPKDPVSVGSFAQNVRWWSRSRPAAETALLALPPADVQASGPTNLEPALFDVISRADAAYPKQLLILSDADAEIAQLAQLRSGLAQKKIRLYLLDTYGKGRGLAALRRLAADSGGSVSQEVDPRKWVTAAHKLLEMANPDRLVRGTAEVRFTAPEAALARRTISLWNRTWMKDTATPLAHTLTGEGPVVLVARWQVGAGQVLAAAFSPAATEWQAFERMIAQRPRDPRFRITWEAGPQFRVTIDAVDGSRYLNRESFYLELGATGGAAASQSRLVPLVAPGRYALAIPAPHEPSIAAVRHEGRVLDRTAVAGRYAQEFDGIGNNTAAMVQLAERTGGRVAPPTHTGPIQFNWPRHKYPLASWLAAAAALFIAAGLLRWRAS